MTPEIRTFDIEAPDGKVYPGRNYWVTIVTKRGRGSLACMTDRPLVSTTNWNTLNYFARNDPHLSK